ncbi:MAG: hypothetical protein HOY79_32945 [Streptomyces sp.]|nr:hypothetical protein [Streptomyces sp.]
MTVQLDTLVASSTSTNAAEPINPRLLSTIARGLTLAELEVALHASGDDLPRSLKGNTSALWALVESGLARIGLVAVRERASKMLAYGKLVSAASKLGLNVEADAAADSYDEICGDRRRSDRCNSLAYGLYFGSAS